MERIKMCLVGLNFGSQMIENELKMGNHELIELSAVCDMDFEKAEKWARKLGCKAYVSIDEVMKDEQIEAVGLFTGPNGRADLIDQIISGGKDVMTTKPFEVSAKKAEAVLKKAKKLGRVVYMNSPSPLPQEDIQCILDWMDVYQLGRPIGFRASVWCTYREQADGSWYDDAARCPVAPVFRLGIYLINDVIPIFGEVEEFHALESRIFTGRPTADNGQLSMRFKNGALGNIYASFCINDGQHYRNTLELNFENGTIYCNAGPYLHESENKCKMELSAMTPDGQIVQRKEFLKKRTGYQWDTFFRAVRGEPVEHTVRPEQIVHGVQVLEAMMDQAKR